MSKTILIIINDAPYGTEKAYNALRIANQLNKNHSEIQVNIFLMADAVSCAVAGQKTPNGYYNIERMLKLSLTKGAKVKLCGSCVDARAITKEQIIEGTEMSCMDELGNWIATADQTLTF
ncbi:hypothetical protein BCY91_16670 [Pelobium manganitolerans]|uniref:Uncharacterized protein n=1 Tax=Pelobium manganitolerans TaxID=1842495 RepID=A0A419S7S3_9SPHI|nr:DsrE family protein [Pelobium manganitolerans]RKD17633.1 hypothetical protein BCY91_16670 [Pelobium manganitolerans]